MNFVNSRFDAVDAGREVVNALWPPVVPEGWNMNAYGFQDYCAPSPASRIRRPRTAPAFPSPIRSPGSPCCLNR